MTSWTRPAPRVFGDHFVLQIDIFPVHDWKVEHIHTRHARYVAQDTVVFTVVGTVGCVVSLVT